MFWEIFGPEIFHRPKCFATVRIDKILVCIRVFVTELEIAASVRNTARGTRSGSASWRTKKVVFFFQICPDPHTSRNPVQKSTGMYVGLCLTQRLVSRSRKMSSDF